MATVKELKKWLNRFPDKTIVKVGFQNPGSNYESYGSVDFISPILEDSDSGSGWEFIDLRGNQFVKKDDNCFGQTFLILGET